MSNEREFSRLPDNAEVSARARAESEGPPPLILGVDTASEKRSLVVTRGGDVTLATHVCERVGSNLSTVLGDIDRVLGAASVSVKEIGLFALAAGPGSFTGLRAGLATVKALALTLGKQAVGIQTLEAIAHAAMASEHVLALMPAGRGEVFSQLFQIGDDGAIVELSPPSHQTPEALIESARGVEGSLTWAGSGAEKYRALIESAARGARIHLSEATSAGSSLRAAPREARVWHLAPPIDALAKDIATLAFERRGMGLPFSAESLRAVYVRGADARVHCA
jgi:tRNA threonylcarbamoyladenosine biosynthesis protein TsaB